MANVDVIFRSALVSDLLSALDFTESIYRGLGRDSVTAESLGMSEAHFGIVSGSIEAAYHALCTARIVAEEKNDD